MQITSVPVGTDSTDYPCTNRDRQYRLSVYQWGQTVQITCVPVGTDSTDYLRTSGDRRYRLPVHHSSYFSDSISAHSEMHYNLFPSLPAVPKLLIQI